jgi:hypothetical protein
MAKKKASQITVEPSEVVLGGYVHISGTFPPQEGDTELIVEAIYPVASPITYEIGPPHEGGELDVKVGTLEPGDVTVRVFAVQYSGEGDQRVAGARTPLGTASFTVLPVE